MLALVLLVLATVPARTVAMTDVEVLVVIVHLAKLVMMDYV